MKAITRFLVTGITVFLWSSLSHGQSTCLSSDEMKTMLAQIDSTRDVALNKKLRSELLKLQDKTRELIDNNIQKNGKDEGLKKRLAESKATDLTELCRILQEFGWPTTSLAGRDGAGAAFYLLKNSAPLELQIELVPVILAAVKKDELAKGDLADLVDHIRLGAGMKQLFGTQASVVDGFLVLGPIEAESQVDARRSQLDLPPLSEDLRRLERVYRMPLVRSPAAPVNSSVGTARLSILKTVAGNLLAPTEGDEVIRIDTNLVSMNVSVLNKRLKTYMGTLLKDDFKVFEDEREESLTYFATTDVAFDLVLLIDLSGSTTDKRDLILKSTQRFIEAARPSDRIAIVTFSDATNVVSPLTTDRAKLLESVNRIEGAGGTKLWDALKLTIDQVVGPKTLERRRAIVVMSDGVDNTLVSFSPKGSQISFADLLEAARKCDALIIPIYLDTEFDRPSFDFTNSFTKRIYENARKTLALLAQASGGLYYQARKLKDLNGVYEQVINDLGKVYSLGYRPTNDKRDGSWSKVRIDLPNHPDLVTRSRPGYYAK